MSVIDGELFFQLLGGDAARKTPDKSYVSGIELSAMTSLMHAFRVRHVAEFGVGTGANAALFLREVPQITSYLGIDVPPGTTPLLEYQRAEVPTHAGIHALHDPRFRLDVRPRGTLDISPGELPPLDFVFIDGDHSPEAVRHDTLLARTAVKNGVICWHDYGNSPAIGPQIVIDELNMAGPNRICLIAGTILCFEIRSAVNCGN